MRGVIGKPYKLDFAEKSPNKYDNSKPKAFHTTPKNKTALQSSSKRFSNLFSFPNRAFCSTPKDEMRSASMLHSLRPASANSKTKTKGSSFLRHVGRDHGSSRNNKGFSDENKSSPSKYNPRIVITNEDGDARKIDEKSSTRGLNVEVVNTRIYMKHLLTDSVGCCLMAMMMIVLMVGMMMMVMMVMIVVVMVVMVVVM